MSKHMSLPADLVSEWLDPRKPEDVPRREKVKWKITEVNGPACSQREVEMTKERRIEQWRRAQPGYKARVKKSKIANSPPIATPAPTMQSVVQPTAQPKPVKGLLLAAQTANLLGGRVGTDNYMVLCPWRKEHKSGRQIHGQHDQSTQINVTEGKFHCQHGPCFTRTAEDFLKELGFTVNVESAPTAPVGKTKVILCIDDSGSISNYGNTETVREQIKIICNQLRTQSPEWDILYIPFGERVDVTINCQAKILPVEKMVADYRPRQGSTKLYNLAKYVAEEALKPGYHATLIYIITDGKEQDSTVYFSTAKEAVSRALSSDRVTFACVGPTAATETFKDYGIPAGCIRLWNGRDGLDLSKVTTEASQGITEFTTARAAGKTKVEKFFIDARKLDGSLKDLVDVTAACKVLHVDREAILQPFVEENKLPFIVGANYYSLTKPETLRPNRAILVRQKGGKQVYSGPNVRKVLGLPNDKECKVEPGDMGTYELFLESTSHNRVLVRGTDLIVRLDHQGSEHTWAVPQPAAGAPGNTSVNSSVKN